MPRIVWAPENVSAVIGHNIFLCHIESQSELPVEFSWLKDGQLLEHTGLKQTGLTTVRMAYNDTIGSLALNNIQQTDDGLYQCIATNHLGYDTSLSASLTVESKSLIIQNVAINSIRLQINELMVQRIHQFM